MDMLVSTERLAEELAAPDLAVLDASLHLPMAERDARAEFEAAHIPGARFLDLAGLHDPASALPGKVPDGERVARWLGERGIGDHLQRLAGRIGEEMQVRAGQGPFRAVDKARDKPLHFPENKPGTQFLPGARRNCRGSLPTGRALIDMLARSGISFD